jgi:glycosyltransferase involved in cell wall biosynthesis
MYSNVSIVIPSKDEELYIKRTLDALNLQIYSNVKIILADSNSTDSTLEIARKICPDIIVVEGGLPAKGRNEGAKATKSEYILFIDADITFRDNDAIKKMLSSIIENNLDAVGTTPVYLGEPDVRANIIFRINNIITILLSKFYPFGIGGCFLIKREVFEKLGGYDEKAYQAEDWLLSKQIDPKKFKIIPKLITQDNRRFKKLGYFNMIKLIWKNWKNRNNIEFFHTKTNYF